MTPNPAMRPSITAASAAPVPWPRPQAEKARARRREKLAVVAKDRIERQCVERNEAGGSGGRHPPAVTDVAVSEAESRFSIILLLRHDAVEPDQRRRAPQHRLLPEAQPVTAYAIARPHDIEAEKGKSRIVGDERQRRDERCVDIEPEEPQRIGRVKDGGIVAPGVPPLGGGPADGDVEIA